VEVVGICGTMVTESGSADVEEDTRVLPTGTAVRSGTGPAAEAFRSESRCGCSFRTKLHTKFGVSWPIARS